MELAARALGRLVKSGAALTSEIVDKEVIIMSLRGVEGTSSQKSS